MAEGLFKKMVRDRADQFEVLSAGISAMDGFPASPETVKVMHDEGVDVSEHQSQRLKADMVRAADKIFVMEKMHKDWILRFVPDAKSKVFLLGEYHKTDLGHTGEIDIPDPIHMSDSFYINVLSVIRECVKKLAENL